MKKFIKNASVLVISSFFIFSLLIIIQPVATSVFADDSAAIAADDSQSSDASASSSSSTPTVSIETAPVSVPTLSTDKADYNPGQTASIFGKFFQSFQSILLKVFGYGPDGNDYTETTQNVTADENGAFSTTYTLDNTYRPFYDVVASAVDGAQLAQTTFTDSVSVTDYSQCSNDTGTGYTSVDTGCRWINGNLQHSNSTYSEGDATVQRLMLTGLTTGTHTIAFQYDTTKAGKHAYDFLTDDKFSENWITNADMCDGASANGLPSCSTLTPSPSSIIPTDPNAAGHDVATSSRHFTIRNGAITGVSTPTIVSGSYAGDSDTEVVVTFAVDAIGTTPGVDECANVATSGNGNNATTTCAVLITFGAHVSKQADWGAGNSAVNITGSPYHVALGPCDGGSCGQKDNQMAASAIIIPNTITIHKATIPAGGVGFGFTDTGGLSPSSFSLNDSGTQTFSPAPGSYTVVETSPLPSYALTDLVCTASGTGTSATPNIGTRTASITIGSAGGGNVDCTYTNTLQQAHLTLVKTVINDNGGTKVVSDFPLFIDGSGVVSGVASTTSAGAHTASETSQAGYATSTWGGDCAADGSITLLPGDNKTCTITNDDIQPKLTVTKIVINHGGNAQVSDFPLFVDQIGMASGVQTGVDAGAHTVSETGSNYYTATISGDCDSQTGAITLAPGEVKSCTITNEEKPAKVVVHKIVLNHGLTNDANYFTPYQVGTTTVTLDATTTMNSGSYIVSEATDANYASTFSQDCDHDGNVILTPGTTKECTITNEEIPTHLTIKKIVINHGLQNDASHFADYKVDTEIVALDLANVVNSGAHSVSEQTDSNYTQTFSQNCANGSITLAPGDNATCTITNEEIPTHLKVTKVVVNHGGSKVVSDFPLFIDQDGVTSGVNNLVNSGAHTVSETGNPDYISIITGDCASDGTIALASGANGECTITNEEKPATLTLVKTVINDNGGTNQVSDFVLKIDDSLVTSGQVVTINSGAHTASEINLPGYDASVWGTDCSADGSITLLPGDNKTCTITNNDIQPKLTLIKHVTNNNGGDAVISDFPLFVGATGVASGVQNGFNAGSYTASETNLTGYAPSVWSGDCAANGSITLSVGDNKTCEITNDDQPAHIILIKSVTNDNGGTSGINDFGLTVGGNPVSSGDNSTVNSNTPIALNEAGLIGYNFVSITGNAKCPSVLGGTTTLDEGETVICTITNDDIAPTLTLVKTVINDNGGTSTVSSFPLFIDGSGVTSGVASTTSAGAHTASETSQTGYTASTWGGDCAADGTITLAPGDNKTCTITNDDQQAYIIVDKTVVNDNGGAANPNDFLLTVDTNAVSDGVAYPVNPGVHSAGETNLPGYTQGAWGGDCDSQGSVSVALGQTKTCTVTNDDIAPRLIVIKHVINNDGDVAVASDFTMQVAGTNVSTPSFPGSENPGTTVTLNAGNYSVNEALNNGYVKTLSAGCAGAIAIGQTKTCTITNNDIPHATRTQGFWQTHTNYTTSIFNQFGGGLTIGSKNASTTNSLFAGFYSSIPKKTNGLQRTALDKARMQMLQQWLAAKLNCKAFGCSSATQTLLANAATAWAGTNTSLILSYASQLDAYNNSNDALLISGQGNATPKTSQSLANTSLSFWNTLP